MSGELWVLIAGCAARDVRDQGRRARSRFGGRDLPPWFAAVIALMAPALLAALDRHRRRSPTASACTSAPTPRAWRRRASSSGAAARCVPARGASAVVVTAGLRALGWRLTS